MNLKINKIMAREIKLNSAEWCDMIFEGKNKAYGAYVLRKTSSKRHIWAFVATVILVGIIVAIPSFLKAVQPAKTVVVSFGEEREVAKLEEQPPIEDVIPLTPTPPTPQIIDSQMFTPPAITADELVDEEKEMATQEELMKDTRRISVETVSLGNTEGVDIEEIRREERNQIVQEPVVDNTVHRSVEVMPQFPGGDAELMRYLSTNIKYPTAMAEIGVEGRAVLQFVVGKDGSVSDIQVISSIHPLGDKEAIRVVQSMPKWIPGQQNGNRVAVYFTLPVHFRLQR